jgi:poly-gamma-glutamate capsule biosynthesis protein CapA/YwtB (metallophosphatase superfamily)
MRRAALITGLAFVALGVVLGWRAWPPFAPKRPPPRRAPKPRSITISFVGDILLASSVGAHASKHGMAHVFAGVSDALRADDLTIGNLECAVATCGRPANKRYTFRADPDLLAGLRNAGVDAVSLANNHALDYGRPALVETLKHLRDAGLPFAGAGGDLKAAAGPTILAIRGQRIALIAASRVLPSGAWSAGANQPGIASAYDPARLLAEIRGAAASNDVVVAYLHWGKERAPMPERYQRRLARQCIEAGADLVIGTHPHVLQGFEFYGGRLIAYSLGNFVFTDRRKTTAILQTTIQDGKLAQAAIIPCSIIDYRPQLIRDEGARHRVLADLEARSFGARISEEGLISARM